MFAGQPLPCAIRSTFSLVQLPKGSAGLAIDSSPIARRLTVV